MIRRLFWIVVGLLFGVWLVRKVEDVQQQARPGAVAERTGRRVGGLQARVAGAVAEGRDAARQREVELRTRYGVPTLIDLARLEAEGRDQPGPDQSDPA